MTRMLQGDLRLGVARIFLDETIKCLREYVRIMKIELFFNLNEVSMSDWTDGKMKKVVLPFVIVHGR
jgi:hypothetical protein